MKIVKTVAALVAIFALVSITTSTIARSFDKNDGASQAASSQSDPAPAPKKRG